MSKNTQHVTLAQDDSVSITFPNGVKVEVSPAEHGYMQMYFPSGGNIVQVPGGYANVLRFVHWPNFEPVIPPSAERPVQVSRDQVTKVMKPYSNGVGQEGIAAVQAVVDDDPTYRVLLEQTINDTLTKRTSSYGYESVIVRQECKWCGRKDTDTLPVNRQNGVWAHDHCSDKAADEG